MNVSHRLTPWCFATLLSIAAIAQEPDYSSELPRIRPTEPEAAISTLSVAEGFEMQLVAAEPLVGSPVAIEWDADGAMYVCEMRGYSENRDAGISRIAKLTDTDHDGVYDTRTEFAAGLFWPTGLFPYDGGLFVGDAPDLLYLKDIDGDGKADLKQRVLTGFGTSNVQGLMNSFRWGLDNRIHIACSSDGGEIRRLHTLPDDRGISIRGRDLALNPRTYEFEPTSGAAQHGMCFDDWGRKFVSSNSDHIQQVMYEDRYIARNPFVVAPPARISIAADGPQAEVFRISPVEPWRIVRTRLRVSGQDKGPIEGGGRAAGYFTGATGVTIYRGDAWPQEWKGLAIVGDVGGNLIHRKRLDVNGLEFTAKRIDEKSEFVASSDIWFRPAQFANGPNGALYVIDVYREVIEHPLSLPDEIKKHLDLTSGHDRGRVYQIVPTGFSRPALVPLKLQSTDFLVQTLAHSNAWHRETAARLLYERQDMSAIESLRKLTRESSSPLGRMHALYALDGLNGLDAATVRSRLSDSHEQVRRHAVRMADRVALGPELLKKLDELVDDPSLEVRYQLAFTLGTLQTDALVARLARLLRQNPEDRWMRAAVLCSIGDEAEQLGELLRLDSSFVGGSADTFLKQLAEQAATRKRVRESGHDVTTRTQIAIGSIRRMTDQTKKREQVVAKYQAALKMTGNIEQGREHFKKQCSSCHRVDGMGNEIGPNLATIKTRGAETLLSAVLDPNREVNPQYLNYVVSMLDGRVLTGMIIDEGSTSMTLRNAQNVAEAVLLIEVDEIKNTGMSMMPEGFEDAMDVQGMADLIAYLLQS
ncbi:MAG: HEAT repeat domain-containing protein [Planctomycetota bacterium]|nr:HEAT repeat domain-containing protein [Planctomycetota bacterium]